MTIKSLSIVAAAALALCAGAAQAAEQMKNGGFEIVDSSNVNLAEGWLSNAGGYVRQSSVVHEGDWAMQIFTTTPMSAYGAEQNNVKDGGMSPLPVGSSPVLSFFATGTAGGTGDLKVRMAYLDGIGNLKWDSGFQAFSGGLSTTEWKQSTLAGPEVMEAGLAAFVQFNLGIGPIEAGLPAGNVYIDSLSVAAVPEPGTYAMMLAGLAGVGFLARRRRRAV